MSEKHDIIKNIVPNDFEIFCYDRINKHKNKEKAITYIAPNKESAKNFCEENLGELEEQAFNFGGRIFIKWKYDCDRPWIIKIPECDIAAYLEKKIFEQPQRDCTMTIKDLVPNEKLIQVAEFKLSAPIARSLTKFASNSDKKTGLVYISQDKREHQIAMSQSFYDILNESQDSIEECVKRQRHQYWHPEDLENFTQEWKRVLEANNPDSVLEFSFRADIEQKNYRIFTNRYRLIEDSLGRVFHESENIDIK